MKRSKFQSKNQIQQNEKNAVVGDGVEGIDFEQKIILVWGKYRYAILIVIGVIVLSLLGYQMMFYLAERKELAVEAAFQEAESDEALLKFAREHPNHQLAGFAYLQLANKKYNENEFIQAIEYYTNAVSQLEDTSIKGRAHLGVAMAHLLTGNIEQGIETFHKITAFIVKHCGLYDDNAIQWCWGNNNHPACSDRSTELHYTQHERSP